MREQNSDHLRISDWTQTELSSALAIMLRTGQIDAQQRARGLALFNQLVSNTISVLPVTSAHFSSGGEIRRSLCAGLAIRGRAASCRRLRSRRDAAHTGSSSGESRTRARGADLSAGL